MKTLECAITQNRRREKYKKTLRRLHLMYFEHLDTGKGLKHERLETKIKKVIQNGKR